MTFGRPKFIQDVLLTLKNLRIKFFDLCFDFGAEKKKWLKIDKIAEISAKK